MRDLHPLERLPQEKNRHQTVKIIHRYIYIKSTLQSCIVLLMLCIVSSIAVYHLNFKTIRLNALYSIAQINEEAKENEKDFFLLRKDYFTDLIMFKTVLGTTLETDLTTEMMVPVVELDNIYTITREDVPSLYTTFDNTYHHINWYRVYWHGYLLPLCLSTSVMSIQSLRIITSIILWSLFILSIYLMMKRLSIKISIAYTVAILLCGFYVVPLSPQFYACFYITLIAVNTILIFPDKFKNIKFTISAFTIIGGLTSYFDLLTTPILTIGMPISILFLLSDNKGRRFNYILGICLSWFIGYFLIWSAKWIIVNLFLNYDLIGEAISQATLRSFLWQTNDGTTAMTFWKRLLSFLVLIGATFIIWYFFQFRHSNLSNKPILKTELFLSLLPFIWYAALLEHTLLHVWFTYRSIAITLFWVFIFILKSDSNHGNRKKTKDCGPYSLSK